MNNPYYYIGPNPTVDLVIENNKKVLLVKRSDSSPACPGLWALPGGFIDSTTQKGAVWKQDIETPKQAAVREVSEEAGVSIEPDTIQPIGIYEGNQRDPRDNSISWSKSHAFYCEITSDYLENNSSEASTPEEIDDVRWFTLDEINNMTLAFDHKKIIMDSPFLKLSKKNKM